MTNPVIESLRAHRSIRRFTDEPITEEELTTILTTAQRGSTSSNLQSYSAVVVRDQKKKSRIAELCGGQQQIIDCSVFIAHCADLNRAKLLCEQGGYEFDSGYIEYFLLGVIDATIFAQTALSAAESMGLGGCMIGGARNHPFELAEELELPPLVFVAFGMTIGHPRPDRIPSLKPRLPLDGIVHRERYSSDQWHMTHESYDAAMKKTGIYDKRRIDLSGRVSGWSEQTPDGEYSWSEHSARRWIDPAARRADLRPFLDRQGFGLK